MANARGILRSFTVSFLCRIKQKNHRKYWHERHFFIVAPIKALCNEIAADWKLKFDRLGVLCGSVTGDDVDFDLNTSKYRIIVTTPEKFDSLSRKWNLCDYMRTIKLLMIDEVILFTLPKYRKQPFFVILLKKVKSESVNTLPIIRSIYSTKTNEDQSSRQLYRVWKLYDWNMTTSMMWLIELGLWPFQRRFQTLPIWPLGWAIKTTRFTTSKFDNILWLQISR